MERSPHLFEDVGVCKNIYHLYVEPLALKAAIQLNRQLGALVEATSPEDFLSAALGFRRASESNSLSGGINGRFGSRSLCCES